MKISEGHLAAWEVTAIVLQEIDHEELDFLPAIMESVHSQPAKIGGVPGAFDYAGTIQSVAVTIFAVVAECMRAAAPKLFDAALDVGKDVAKKIVERRLETETAATPKSQALDPAHIHELVRAAALERKMSPANADAIANAVVARLALAQRGNGKPA